MTWDYSHYTYQDGKLVFQPPGIQFSALYEVQIASEIEV